MIPLTPLTVTVIQRTAHKIPVDAPVLQIAIADITAGQTITTVQTVTKPIKTLLDTASLKQGDAREFELGGYRYELKLLKLHNLLMGDDFAEFQIRGVDAAHLNDAEKIDAAIARIESSNLTFIRNGTEHSAKDAAAHLRTKRKNAGADISYEKFLNEIAAKSAMTGQPYLVKLSDGQAMEVKTWLTK